jgi:hypothetical protein
MKTDPRKRYANDAERQTARRVRRYAAGLNSQGRTYRRHQNFVTPNESPSVRHLQELRRREHALNRQLARWYRVAAENRAKGLRVDGKPFRRHTAFQAWKQFRAGMAAAPSSNWETIERL